MKKVGLFLILISILLGQRFSFTPDDMRQLVIKGFEDDGIKVQCTIDENLTTKEYNYRIIHIDGFESENDFLFASMGTIATNSAFAGFNTKWLYMAYDNSEWRIATSKCRLYYNQVMNENQSMSEQLDIIGEMMKNIEMLK